MTGSRAVAERFISPRAACSAAPQGRNLAVQNCRLRASSNPPAFDREGAFRSWLLRILIDEASSFLQQAPPQANGL
jgi:hypothetical protein